MRHHHSVRIPTFTVVLESAKHEQAMALSLARLLEVDPALAQLVLLRMPCEVLQTQDWQRARTVVAALEEHGGVVRLLSSVHMPDFSPGLRFRDDA